MVLDSKFEKVAGLEIRKDCWTLSKDLETRESKTEGKETCFDLKK
jgi:hypothetical protein